MDHLNSNDSHSQLLQVSQRLHPLTYCTHDTLTPTCLQQMLPKLTEDQLNHYGAFIKCGHVTLGVIFNPHNFIWEHH